MLVVDTGVLVAATDRNDPHHAACVDLLTAEYEPLVTTGLVIAESAYLLDRELGPAVEATLYQSIIERHLIIEASPPKTGAAFMTWLFDTPTCVSEVLTPA